MFHFALESSSNIQTSLRHSSSSSHLVIGSDGLRVAGTYALADFNMGRNAVICLDR